MNKWKIGLIAAVLMNTAHAKGLDSGDIAGRDLIAFGLGWIGHVAIGTGDYVGYPTDILIEALNEASIGNPVIQINAYSDFRSRSTYWGSRFGIGDYASGTYAVLVEANHQRWWCPSYTLSTAYIIGQGNTQTGQVTKCGMWRCDTLVAWSFYSAGYYQLMNNTIMLPRNVFYTFPYDNNEILTQVSEIKPPNLTDTDQVFSIMTAQQLNEMPYEEFAKIADIPLDQETPDHIATEWRFANDDNVNEVKRGIFIDRLSVLKAPDTLSKFIKMYQEEKSPEVKTKLLQGIMINYQNNMDVISTSPDYELLKTFYSSLFDKPLNRSDADKVIRGYIDFHSPEELLVKASQIDKKSVGIEPHLLLGLRNNLVYKSAELEKIYVPSIINMLKKSNRSDLDEMFFGVTKENYKLLRNPESISEIKEYISLTNNKYMSQAMLDGTDPYLGFAKKSFIALSNELSSN